MHSGTEMNDSNLVVNMSGYFLGFDVGRGCRAESEGLGKRRYPAGSRGQSPGGVWGRDNVTFIPLKSRLTTRFLFCLIRSPKTACNIQLTCKRGEVGSSVTWLCICPCACRAISDVAPTDRKHSADRKYTSRSPVRRTWR